MIIRNETLEVNNKKFPVIIHIEERLGSKVMLGKKSINMHVPNFLSREEIFREILKMKSWAMQKILNEPEKFIIKSSKTYMDGQEIQVGEEKFILKISFLDKRSSSASMIEKTIFLYISDNLSDNKKNKHISTLISRCIAQKKITCVKERINMLNNQHFQKDVNKIFLKNNSSKWGSCSEKGNINISTRLLFAPQEVQDYIFIHELAHLSEHNHSDKFWDLVKKAMPSYKEKENWLKSNSHTCNF